MSVETAAPAAEDEQDEQFESSAHARTGVHGRPPAWAAALADVVAVIAFAAIGMASHGESIAVDSLARVALPFLVGAGIGWILVRAWRAPYGAGAPGVAIWLSTVVVGVAIRGIGHQGAAPSFVIVTTLVLAVLLIGWRLAVRPLVRRR